VAERLEGLRIALAAGEGRFDPDAAKRAREVIDRAGERLRLGADLTVVALVGATGSGKSSIFNALAGMELAEVGVRRPTTGQAMACVWAMDGADPLLDWLGVPRRQRTNRRTVLDADTQDDLHGLVLLDLPDHDSTATSHRLEVDRLVELVDLLVWVVDPQKYADEVLHSGYLRRLVGHEAVMLVVLNQLDRLTQAEAQTCATDLRRLLDSDGLSAVTMLTTSATTGAGIDDLRRVLSDLVQRRGAFAGRTLADLDGAVGELRSSLGATEPHPNALPGSEELVTTLAQSAGVPVILDSVEAEYLREAQDRTGWPPFTWYRRLRPDSLGRLGLPEETEAQVRELARPSAPASTTAHRAQVEQAVRSVTDATVADLPQRWTDAVRAATVAPTDDLGRALDGAVAAVDLTLRRPSWWRTLQVVQVALVAITVIGLLWWLGLGIVRATGSSASGPSAGPLPLPAVLFLAGAVLGGIAAVLAHWTVRAAARRRRSQVGDALRTAITSVAAERVLAPVAAVVTEHRTARQALGG
jgi:GTPase Era involved in 16S rRNA processing